MKDIESIVFEIISNGGNAKGLIYEAISCSERGDFKEADALLEEADVYLTKAHKIQTELIQQEASGNHNEVTILFVHAQDHLMSAMEVKTMAEKLIRINKRIYDLEQKM
ncbi:MAG TPA: PTS lactose/cellobiose transporter subunit IIA [Candidatus Dwaynia gallinarum]|nr:PTS lactose/cellobiose transporter subunit IIA [Candidatus Dwaynia gallinarum]